jgi:manganese efflux pump family protein
MSTWALALLAVALSADAAAVAASAQQLNREAPWWARLRLPVVFALVHGALCGSGLLGAGVLRGRIEAYDHWLAFALLAGVGVHMLLQARGEVDRPAPQLTWSMLLALAFATGIDGLAAGMGLALLDVPVWSAVACVSGASLLVSFLAAWLAGRLGRRFGQRAEFFGGWTLIAIGTGLVLDHTQAFG